MGRSVFPEATWQSSDSLEHRPAVSQSASSPRLVPILGTLTSGAWPCYRGPALGALLLHMGLALGRSLLSSRPPPLAQPCTSPGPGVHLS